MHRFHRRTRLWSARDRSGWACRKRRYFSPGVIPIGFDPEPVTGIHSKPGSTQPPIHRFSGFFFTTPVFFAFDFFAVEFGGIITISILLVSIRIRLTRIRTQLLMRFLTRLRISKESVA